MGTFTISRSTEVQAPAATVHDLITDYRRWVDWSPWEGIDPDLQRTYTGPEAAGTTVVPWTMSGEHRGLRGLLMGLLPLDKIVGKDFEKGLARLKVEAEA